MLAEVLAEAARGALPAAVRTDALICCGYPLHKPKAPAGADPKRADHLRRLPASVRTLFVQGECDQVFLELICHLGWLESLAHEECVAALPEHSRQRLEAFRNSNEERNEL